MMSFRSLSSIAARCRTPAAGSSRGPRRRCRTTAAPALRPSRAHPRAHPRARLPAPVPRRPVSGAAVLRAELTFAVPSMGDSITEGTIVEWCVAPGAHVREGDVLALIETDKVTVDIKAERDGVLVQQLGEAEAEVEVGAGLYVLDTDAGSVERAALDADVAALNAALDADAPGEAEAGAGTAAAAGTPAAAAARVPSIHFLGKAGWRARRTMPAAPVVAAPTRAVPRPPHAATSVTAVPYAALRGRPPITEEEMEALVLGGAEEAPEVQRVVSAEGVRGATFAGGRVVTTGPRGVWLAAEY